MEISLSGHMNLTPGNRNKVIFSAHESEEGRAALNGVSLHLGRAHCQVLPAEHGLLPRMKSFQ